MRRTAIVAFALLGCLLVVSATPASAANLSVGSQKTDFGTGDETPPTLTNATVDGTGDSARVILGADQATYDRFEDGDVDGWDASNPDKF
ncbi:hypothetical protein ELS19_19775, partial [Halogeometricum borinquense]